MGLDCYLYGAVVTDVTNSEQVVVESRVDQEREVTESFATGTERILNKHNIL